MMAKMIQDTRWRMCCDKSAGDLEYVEWIWDTGEERFRCRWYGTIWETRTVVSTEGSATFIPMDATPPYFAWKGTP